MAGASRELRKWVSGQLEQNSWDRATHSRDRTAGIGQLGQDNRDKTAGTGHLGQDSRDRRTGTEKSERQTGYYSQDRKQRQNGQNMTASTGLLRQDSQDGITTAVERGYLGQHIQQRKDIPDGTTVLDERGQPGHDPWERTTRTFKTVGQDSWDRTFMTGQSQQVGPTGQPRQVSLDR